MDGNRFDALVQSLSERTNRRSALAALFGLLGALGSAIVPPLTARAAKSKKTRLVFNAFGCVDVGGACRGNDAKCCSGLCEGKKPKKGKKDKSRCVEHNTGGCLAGQDFCLTPGMPTPCGTGGLCARTTGQAGFCLSYGVGACTGCKKDAECQAAFGPGAACVVCPAACPATTTGCWAPAA